MRPLMIGLCALALSLPFALPLPADYVDEGFCSSYEGLTDSERAGCQIWFYSTASNSRFHTYVFQQRLGVMIDWFRVLNARERAERFKVWGLINDGACCTPGSANCPAKSYDETYGFDWCPGDEELLSYVGKAGYRDPACNLKDGAWEANGHGGSTDNRESPCSLDFGTSTGVMGLRKFPNPKFNAEAWRKINGSLGTWEGYRKPLSADPKSPDSRKSRLIDGAIEPPFLIGMACGACHISFNPLNPPKDPANPKPENVRGLVGNQYSRLSEVMASGMSPSSIEWQMFAHARPGTVDTSAVPNDQRTNPGTINALINLERRPTFDERVVKWRRTESCPAGSAARECWCEPGKDGKCWKYGEETEAIHHILKGGEDSTGALEAIQRVYVNIGSCSEQCWVNHITDLRQADPAHRGFGQTPFDVGQCRRDCASFRAIEDRLSDIKNFLFTARPTELYQARGLPNREALVSQLDREFGSNAVERGREIFSRQCARCHSSQEGDPSARDYWATVEGRPDLRADWMGNDKREPVSEIGVNRSRSLHSNHMTGQIWQAYGSEDLRAQPDLLAENVPEPTGGGRGSMRNISLLSLWAHAPLLHNNAVGPELCGDPADSTNEFYRSPYVDKDGKKLENPPPCWAFDPSVEGRYKLYKASMDLLLNPDKRIDKISLLSQPVIIDAGPRLFDDDKRQTGISIEIPAGVPAAFVGSLEHKQLIGDVALAKTDPKALRAKFLARGVSDQEADAIVKGIQGVLTEIIVNPEKAISIVGDHRDFLMRFYSNTTDLVENKGHRFGEDLSESDKKALTAFLATL
jgi:hypothetical protein